MSLAIKPCTECKGKGGYNVRIPFEKKPYNKQWERCEECQGSGEQLKPVDEWEADVRVLSAQQINDFTDVAELACAVPGLLTMIDALREQLTPGSMTERAPTQWAYQQAWAAVEKHRKRADAAEALLTQAAKAMAGSYDVTDYPANGSTDLDTAIKAIHEHQATYAK